MKIALYIEDGLEQIVLTPASATEDGILDKIHDGSRQLSIKRGEFYGCRGGWTRHKKQYNSPYGSDEPNDESTIIVLTVPPPPPPVNISDEHDARLAAALMASFSFDTNASEMHIFRAKLAEAGLTLALTSNNSGGG